MDGDSDDDDSDDDDGDDDGADNDDVDVDDYSKERKPPYWFLHISRPLVCCIFIIIVIIIVTIMDYDNLVLQKRHQRCM